MGTGYTLFPFLILATMIQYNTSLRIRSIPETIAIAKTYASRFGITRVTNTTWLDNIGIPVYVSIRPDAKPGSLCVSSGKGLQEEEAKVGAYMEGLELAMIEPHRGLLKVKEVEVADILDGRVRTGAILDLCPKMGQTFEASEKIDAVEAEELISGRKMMVPAELAFLPYRKGKRKFGSSSNGVASGNSLAEASLHGILEVIERDIMSFQTVRGDSIVIDPATYPENARMIYDKVKAAGHELILKYARNEFNIPFVISNLLDGQSKDPSYFNGGFGCHFYTGIALMRAASEAVQSRLAYIHGGRDDLIDGYKMYEDWSYQQRVEEYQRISNNIHRDQATIAYEDIPQLGNHFGDIDAYMDYALELLQSFGFNQVLRIRYTQPEEPIQIIKILIPRMEFFTLKIPKIGPRLKAYVDNFWS